MKKKLIITADDYGAIDYIDEAILAAAAGRRISSVAVLVSELHQRPQAATRLLQVKQDLKNNYNFDLGIGLHLSITSGTPQIPVLSKLSENIQGHLRFKEMNIQNPLSLSIQENQTVLYPEIEKQLETFKTYFPGIEVDHISCHHNILYFQWVFFGQLVKLAGNFDIPLRSPKRWTKFHRRQIEDTPAREALFSQAMRDRPKGDIFYYLRMTKKETQLQQSSICDSWLVPHSHYLLIEMYGNPNRETLAEFIAVHNPAEVSEVIFHLGDFSRLNGQKYHGINLNYLRYKEFDFVMSDVYLQVLQNVELHTHRSHLV